MDDECPTEYSAPCLLPLAAGTPVTGLWCETCLLPSRYKVPVYALSDDGPRLIGVVFRCGGCQP